MPRPSRDVPDASEFGRKLRRIRIESGMTIEEVSNQTGLAESVLRKMETAASYNPKLETLRKLAQALGVKVKDLTGEE